MSLTESDYHDKIDATLLAVEEALDILRDEQDIDIDYINSGGVLTMTFDNGSKIILNRQTPLLQLWVAAKSNGYHLDWQADKNTWQVGDETFIELMDRLCSEQAEREIELNLET